MYVDIKKCYIGGGPGELDRIASVGALKVKEKGVTTMGP